MKKGMVVAIAALGMTACSSGGNNSGVGSKSSILTAEKASSPEQCPALSGTYDSADSTHRPYQVARDSAGQMWLSTSGNNRIRLDGVRRTSVDGSSVVGFCQGQIAFVEGTDKAGNPQSATYTATAEGLEVKVNAKGQSYTVVYRQRAGTATAPKGPAVSPTSAAAAASGPGAAQGADGSCPQLEGQYQLIENGKPPMNNPVVLRVNATATGSLQIVMPDQSSFVVDGVPRKDANGEARLASCDKGSIFLKGADAPKHELNLRISATTEGLQVEGPGADGQPQTVQYRKVK